MLSIKRVGLQNGQTISHFSVHLLWTSTYFMNNNRMSMFLLHGGCSWSQTRAVDVLRLWCQLLETAGSLTSRHWDCIPIKQLLEETSVSEEGKGAVRVLRDPWMCVCLWTWRVWRCVCCASDLQPLPAQGCLLLCLVWVLHVGGAQSSALSVAVCMTGHVHVLCISVCVCGCLWEFASAWTC